MTNSKATKRVCAKCQFEDDTGLKICPRDGSPMTSRAKDALLGQVIDDKYEILSMLGKGGMSVVYKAKHTMMNRMVAVKMLRPELVAVPQLLQRFKQESNAVSALRHPNIVTVFDYGLLSTSGTPYLIMDYLEGDILTTILKRDHHLAPERAVPLFAQACDALAHAHDQGVIHRDIKPSNLLVRTEKNGEESLTIFDFGIAKLLGQDGSTIHKLTTSGEVFGSPLYMSPEQCSGEHVTKKTDIYSLACVLYETLCGQPPLGGTSPMETLMKHVNEDPPTISEVNPELDLPEGLEDAVMQALAKDPAERQIDMRQFRDQILEAGNLRILSSSLHLTKENTMSGVTEAVVSNAPPRVSSAAVPQPPSKRKTAQRSSPMSAHKPKQKGEDNKIVPMPLLIGLAVVIALGSIAGVAYMLLHHDAAIVVPADDEPAQSTSSSSDTEETEEVADFDGEIVVAKLPNRDYLLLMELQKHLQCRVDLDGKLVTAAPPPLLTSSVERAQGRHTDMRCIAVPVDITPAKITCLQSANALFDKLFAEASPKPTWEQISEKYGAEAESGRVLVQEITFPPEEPNTDEATSETTEPKAESESESVSEETTRDVDEGAEESKKPDEPKDEPATTPPSSTDKASTADAASSAPVKEYIVYLKHKGRLVACQFLPLKITESELEQTIREFVPILKRVVKRSSPRKEE